MANAFNKFINSLGTKKPNIFASGTVRSLKNANQVPLERTVPGVSYLPESAKNIPSATNPTKTSVSSATKPAPTVIKPPSTSAQPPLTNAGQQYVQNLAENTQPTASPTPKLSPAPKQEQNAYLEYLKTVFNPEQLRIAQQNQQALNERTSREILRAREREDELRANEIGQLEAGQRYQLGENERLSNRSLADLAIAKGANMEVYNQMLSAGKSMYEAEQAQRQYDDELAAKEAERNAPFELSEGQSRYEYDPATGQYKMIASKGKTYAPSSGGGTGGSGVVGVGSARISPAAQNILQQLNMGANLDDLIKGSSNASQALRNEVLAALNEQGGVTERQKELFREANTAVDKLLASGYKALGGYSRILGGKYTTAYGDAKAQAQQLQAILARDNLGLLKGAMSDKDLAFIQSMSSGFEGEGIQSEKFIKERLGEIKTKIQKKLGEPAPTSTGNSTSSNSGVTPSGVKYTVEE